MKSILFKTNHDKWYTIEVKHIAALRANYYSTVDGYELGSKEWQDEVDFLMKDNYEAIDYLTGSTDFSDIKDAVKEYIPPKKEYKEKEQYYFDNVEDFKVIELN